MPSLQMSPQFGLGALLEHLYNRIRIKGWLRLGGNVLLQFTEELPPDWKENDPNQLPPKAVVRVYVAVPAPREGVFASQIAHGIAETVSAICTFAFMRAADLPPFLMPATPDEIAELQPHLSGQATLARRGVSLDIFGAIGAPGGLDHFYRLCAAFLTFDAVKQQRHDLVACVLYVVAAECLSTPSTKWHGAQITTRFIQFYDELMPTILDEMVGHGNFEDLFPIKRGKRNARRLRRELLSHMYEFRSGNVHRGLQPNYRGFGFASGVEDVRRGFFAEFAEYAILEYLKSPRCSFVGHPAYDKPVCEHSDGGGI